MPTISEEPVFGNTPVESGLANLLASIFSTQEFQNYLDAQREKLSRLENRLSGDDLPPDLVGRDVVDVLTIQ